VFSYLQCTSTAAIAIATTAATSTTTTTSTAAASTTTTTIYYLRQVNEVNGRDNAFVRCVSVCVCVWAQRPVMGVKC